MNQFVLILVVVSAFPKGLFFIVEVHKLYVKLLAKLTKVISCLISGLIFSFQVKVNFLFRLWPSSLLS